MLNINKILQIPDSIYNNLALLEFRRQADHTIAIQKMDDGFVDEYEDETGVDTVNSKNQIYDSVNDFYKPSTTPTVLLLHGNGTDGSTIFTDEAGKTVTPAGNAQIDTAQSKFGGASMLFDGTGDYLTVPDSADWVFGTGDFTIDFWVRAWATGVRQRILTQLIGVNNCLNFRIDTDNKLYFIAESAAGASLANYNTTDAVNIADAAWHHIAFVRSGTNFYIFLDGVSQGLTVGTAIGANSLSDGDSALFIAANATSGLESVNGWIDEFRISKGVARWTANFTPPTAAYTIYENMTIISAAQTADTAPNQAKIIIFEEDVDAITLNTDLKAYASRDNGSTWTQATLTNAQTYETGKNILIGTATISGQPAGTSMRYKIETLNQKNLKINGAALIWL